MKMKRKAAIAAAVMTAVFLLGGCAAETEEKQTNGMEPTTDHAVQQEEPEKPEVWTPPEQDAWPALLDHVQGELDGETRPWMRFASLPEGDPYPNQWLDPSLYATSNHPDMWQLLAEIPEKGIMFYYGQYTDRTIFLRYGTHFQIFEQDISRLDILPELTETEWEGNYALSVFYRHHTEDGGITGETVVYSWDGRSWTDHHFPSDEILEDPERPDLSDLRLAAELTEKDIAVYSDPQTGKSWLRSNEQIQEITDLVSEGAELHYDDINGDGNEELVILSASAADGGFTLLSVYHWTGQCWKGCRDHPPTSVIDSRSHPRDIFQFYEDGTAYVMYGGRTMLLDLSSICPDWEAEPAQGVLDGSLARYTCQNGELLRTLPGYIADHNDTPVFACTSPIEYYGSWMHTLYGELHSPYEIKTEFHTEQLSNAQGEVLRRFVRSCQETIADKELPEETLFQCRLALCDLDSDGYQELLLEANSKDFSDYYGLSVYRTDGRHLCGFWCGSRFYDNGVIWEPWSHNQGVDCAIWPFHLYRLQGTDYVNIGVARARSSRIPGEFPAEADLDGDGLVYLVGEDAVFHDGDYVDNAVYDEWWDSRVGNARLLPVCYFPLTEEIIDSLK